MTNETKTAPGWICGNCRDGKDCIVHRTGIFKETEQALFEARGRENNVSNVEVAIKDGLLVRFSGGNLELPQVREIANHIAQISEIVFERDEAIALDWEDCNVDKIPIGRGAAIFDYVVFIPLKEA